MPKVDPRRVFKDPVLFLAFGFGSGLAPVAPGTFGTLPALLIAWLTRHLALEWRALILAAMILFGVWLCGEAARRLGEHDHPGIVWDEIAGMYMVLLVTPVTLWSWLAAFALFRLFDIWKPWPIRDLDHRLGGGVGIMLDDLVAALYAALILAFSVRLMV